MAFVRYGIGGGCVLAGVISLVVAPGELGLEGFALFVGAGLSIMLLSLLYRYGVRGDEERAHEEHARRYFEEHGVWPDEAARGEHASPQAPSMPTGPPAASR
jgi:hypothetical protein